MRPQDGPGDTGAAIAPRGLRPAASDLNQIKAVLASMGLRLGMVRQVAISPGDGCELRGSLHLPHPGWPPENIEEMAKKLEQELLG